MLKVCAWLPLLTLVACPCSGQAHERYDVVWCKDLNPVPLYSEKGKISTKFGEVLCDTRVTVLSLHGEWAHVRTNGGVEGYIREDSLVVGNGTPRTPILVFATIEPAPGIRTQCAMDQHTLRKLKTLQDTELAARFTAVAGEVAKLQLLYTKAAETEENPDDAEDHLLVRKMELFTLLYLRHHSQHQDVTPQESELVFSYGLSPPPVCREFSLDLSQMRSLPSAIQDFLSQKVGPGAPQIVAYEGIVLGFLEANPLQASLEVKPGGQPVVFKRRFQPVRQDSTLQGQPPKTSMVYELSISMSPKQIPKADFIVNDVDQLIFESGRAKSPEWIWEFKPRDGFEKATITLNGQLSAYEDKSSWEARKPLGSPDAIVVPLATFVIRKSPGRAYEFTTHTWHLLVELFGVIGAVPTILLLLPRLRKWIQRKWRWLAKRCKEIILDRAELATKSILLRALGRARSSRARRT